MSWFLLLLKQICFKLAMTPPGDSSGESLSIPPFLVSLPTAQPSGLNWQSCLTVTILGHKSISESYLAVSCPEIASWQVDQLPASFEYSWFVLWVLSLEPWVPVCSGTLRWCCQLPCGLLVDDSFVHRDQSRALGGRKLSDYLYISLYKDQGPTPQPILTFI